MSQDTREPRIRAAVPCPLCGAPIGQPCRKGIHPHDARRGARDLRPVMLRAHQERRDAWLQWKREHGITGQPDQIGRVPHPPHR